MMSKFWGGPLPENLERFSEELALVLEKMEVSNRPVDKVLERAYLEIQDHFVNYLDQSDEEGTEPSLVDFMLYLTVIEGN